MQFSSFKANGQQAYIKIEFYKDSTNTENCNVLQPLYGSHVTIQQSQGK